MDNTTKPTTKITIHGNNSIISGEKPLQAIVDATSYDVEGARYSQAFKKGVWDGKKHLFNKKTGAFPTGLVNTVRRVCEEHGYTVEIDDNRKEPEPMHIWHNPSFALNEVKMEGKFAYQLDACQKAVKAKQGIIRVATNGGKSTISAAIISYVNVPTLFVVPTRELLYQVYKVFTRRIPGAAQAVGMIGDGKWEPGSWITVATMDTLESRIDQYECRKFLGGIEMIMLDECQHAASETWYTVLSFCPAFYRFGLSGTPLNRSDGADLRLIAQTGDIIVDIGNKFLVESGVSARAKIIFDRITQPVMPKKKIAYATAYKEGVVKNDVLLQRIVEWTSIAVSQGLSVLILIDEIDHGRRVDEALWTAPGQFISHQFIHGEESTDTRAQALTDFAERRIPVLIASTILDEGVDVPVIDMLICAGSRKSKIKTLQRLGRGLRGEKLIVIEFANFTNKYLLEHSLTRLQDYKAEDCFIIKQSGPNAQLVEELWKLP